MSADQLLPFVLFILGLACAVLGWFLRQMYDALGKLKDDLAAMRFDIGSNYVRYDRLQDALKPLLDGLGEIKEALRGKADKP